MDSDILVKNGVIIPVSEVEIKASRSGGPGGQHVNKSDTRITVRWNVLASQALTEGQKARVMQKLASQLTQEGDLVIHSSASRSQQYNKKEALRLLAERVKKGLYIPKKRMKTRLPKAVKESRLQKKAQRGTLKRLRSKKILGD